MRIIQLPSIILLGLTTSWAAPAAARPGSSRAGRTQISGAVAANNKGNRVALKDWRRTTFRDNGEVLRGIMIDPGSGRTIAIRLAKVKEGQ